MVVELQEITGTSYLLQGTPDVGNGGSAWAARAALGIGLIFVLFLLAGSSEAGVHAKPATLLSVVGSIDAFAQDGNEVAWTSGRADCPMVRVRALGSEATSVLASTNGGDGCLLLDGFAIGGTQVVWGGFEDCCNNGYGTVETAAPHSKTRQLRSMDQDYHVWGDFLTGAAGDGSTLVYSLTTIDLAPGYKDCPDGPCAWDVTGGGVWRVVGRRQVRVAGTPPTALVAAAHGRIAIVPTERRHFPGPCISQPGGGCPEVRAAEGGPVLIVDARSGVRKLTFAPQGRVTALALDTHTATVLARSGRTARVEWYSVTSGQRLGAKAVPWAVADLLDASGNIVVLRRGRMILALNTVTNRSRQLARARAKPIGLSIEGRRVAWAETFGGRGFIRTVGAR